MREQITQDLAVSAAKIAPPAIASAFGVGNGWTLADWAMLLTIIFTLAQLFTVTVKNWGDWMGWWRIRIADMRRLWRWIRSR